MLKKLIVAAAAGTILASSAGAVTTITFASFDVRPSSARNFSYTVDSSGATISSVAAGTTRFNYDTTTVTPVTFSLNAASAGGVSVDGTSGTQLFNGSFSFTSGSTNLLTGSFTNASLTGSQGANSFTFNGNSAGGGNVTYTSGLPFTFLPPNDFSFSVTGLTRSIGYTAGGNFYGSGSAAGSVTGNFSSAVPEPETWAMMILGFGMIGFAMRRRDRVRRVIA